MENEAVAELRERLSAIREQASATWDDLAPLEPLLTDLLAFVKEHPNEQRMFEDEFLSLLDERSDGVDETIEFCMHTLRWPRIEAAVTARRDAISEGEVGRLWNERRRWQRLADSFQDDWTDAALWEHYRR